MGAALDNLADGSVYAVSLYAVGHSVVAKARAARLSGFFLIALAVGLLVEVLRRFAAGGQAVGLVVIVAAVANAAPHTVCLRLLPAHREKAGHLHSPLVFITKNT